MRVLRPAFALIAAASSLSAYATSLEEQIRMTLFDDATPAPQIGPLLVDMLTIESSVSIFYSYARETRFNELMMREDARITVLAPSNKAVMALARKPHQGPGDAEEGTVITEEEFDRLAKDNVEKWVGAHIIPQHPIDLLPTSQFKTMLKGCVVTLTSNDDIVLNAQVPSWSNVVINGNISITKEASAGNGKLYLIDGAIYG